MASFFAVLCPAEDHNWSRSHPNFAHMFHAQKIIVLVNNKLQSRKECTDCPGPCDLSRRRLYRLR